MARPDRAASTPRRPGNSPTRWSRPSIAAPFRWHRASLSDGRFLPGQDTGASLPPVTPLNPPPSEPLFHAEPFGPVDTIVLVDTEAELLAAMNASNGALIATLSTDDPRTTTDWPRR